jgi:hypothetical protein
VAYLLIVEQVAARTLADRQGLIVASAVGADVGVLPDVDEEIAKLDAALDAVPQHADPKRRMARFLGVA